MTNQVFPKSALTAFFASLPERPRLLGLGEPTHGLDAFPRWRNRLLRVLVQEYGFRSVALESDILAGQLVNAYVLGASDDLDGVLAQGFSHNFGAYPANRELVAWLREFNARQFNAGRPEAEQVRFYGFDAPMENRWAASPRPNLLALHDFLSEHLGDTGIEAATLERLCGEDSRWTNEAAAMNPAESVGNTPEAQELRVLADDLQTLLQREKPRLHALPGFWEAELHARTALGLLRYHANMARPDQERPQPDRLPTMLALRDLMMADNLEAIAAREQGRGPTLVFAHNLHLGRGVSGMTMPVQGGGQRLEWWGAGAHLAGRMGPGYAFIASGLGRAEALGIGDPAPDTFEGHLLGLPGDVGLFFSDDLNALRALPLIVRTDFPPQAFALKKTLLAGADGVLFVRDAG